MSHNSVGITPLKLFWFRFSHVNCLRLPMTEGISPDRRFLYRESHLSFLRFPICVGRVPFKLLLLMLKYSRFLRFPISGGISPVRLLLNNFNDIKFFNLPISAGILPLIWLLLRSISRVFSIEYTCPHNVTSVSSSTRSSQPLKKRKGINRQRCIIKKRHVWVESNILHVIMDQLSFLIIFLKPLTMPFRKSFLKRNLLPHLGHEDKKLTYSLNLVLFQLCAHVKHFI